MPVMYNANSMPVNTGTSPGARPGPGSSLGYYAPGARRSGGSRFSLGGIVRGAKEMLPGAESDRKKRAAEEMSRAAQEAAAKQRAFGQDAWNRAMAGKDTAMGYYKPALGQYESLYGAGGSMTRPGALEERYARLLAGERDPDYERRKEQGIRDIAFRANQQGGLYSGGRAIEEGAYLAELEAERYRELNDMAAQAQAAQQQRLLGALNAALGIGGAQAGLYKDFFGQGMQGWTMGESAAIESDYNAALYRAQKKMEPNNPFLASTGRRGWDLANPLPKRPI